MNWNRKFSISTVFSENSVLFGLFFMYLATLSAEKLNVLIYLFKPRLNHLLAIALFMLLLILKRRISLSRDLLLAGLFIFVSVAVSSTQSIIIQRSLGYVFIYLFIFIFYFILPYQLFEFFDRQKIIMAYFLSFKIIGIYAFLQVAMSLLGVHMPFAHDYLANRVARGESLCYEASYYALYMTPYVMFLNAKFFLSGCKFFSRKGKKLLVVPNLLLLISTSTGAFISYFIFFAVILGISFMRFCRRISAKYRKKLFSLAVVFAGIMGLLSIIFHNFVRGTFLKFFYYGLGHWSFALRWQGIVSSWKVFLSYPFLGVGLGGVGPMLLKQERGVDPGTCSLKAFEPFDPTNVLFEMISGLGLIGLLAFGLFAWIYFQKIWKTLHFTQIEKEERVIILAFIISIIMQLIVLQFNQGLFRPYIWTHLAIVLGYVNSVRRQRLGART